MKNQVIARAALLVAGIGTLAVLVAARPAKAESFAFYSFIDHKNIIFNGSAHYMAGFPDGFPVARLTDGGRDEAASMFYANKVNITSFSTSFTFRQIPYTNQPADGLTFIIHGRDPYALGPSGGGLGYGNDNLVDPPLPGMKNSIAIKFALYALGNPWFNTGLYRDGQAPVVPSIVLPPSLFDVTKGHLMQAFITYDGSVLGVTILDTETGKSFSFDRVAFFDDTPLDLPAVLGGNTAYVGFTAGTGGLTAIQDIMVWEFSSPDTQE